MRTEKYLAEKGCKVKVGGVEYFGDKAIPVGDNGLSESDIKGLLARKFIRKIGFEESDNGDESLQQGNAEGKEAAKKEKLLAKARKLGIEVPETATVAEIEKLLEEAK